MAKLATPLSPVITVLPGLVQAIAAKDRMGWPAFFEGCIAGPVEWAGVQEAQHFLWLGHRNTDKQMGYSSRCQTFGDSMGSGIITTRSSSIRRQLKILQVMTPSYLQYVPNMCSALQVFLAEIGISSTTLLSLFFQARCITSTHDYSMSRLPDLDKNHATPISQTRHSPPLKNISPA
jgi:hypothetical protein